jgi:hypothetical protein
MTGAEVVRRVRAFYGLALVPAVFVSSELFDPADPEASAGVVLKPFLMSDLSSAQDFGRILFPVGIPGTCVQRVQLDLVLSPQLSNTKRFSHPAPSRHPSVADGIACVLSHVSLCAFWHCSLANGAWADPSTGSLNASAARCGR